MQFIKSDLKYDRYSIKKPIVLDNLRIEIKNIIDMLDISNDFYHFLHNHSLNSKKKCVFLYILYHIEIYFYTRVLIKLIQFTNWKKRVLPIYS